MDQNPLIFTGSFLLGRVLPIAYFLIVIPGLLELLFKIFVVIVNSSRTELKTKLGRVDNPHHGFYMLNDVAGMIFMYVAIVLVFAVNVELAALTSKLTVTNNTIKYQELFINGWHKEEIDISDIEKICEDTDGSYASAGKSYWIISTKDKIISTARIGDQYRMIMALLDRADIQKQQDGDCYYNPSLMDERGL